MGFEREKRLGLVGLDPEQRAARLEELRKEIEQREKNRAAWLEQQEKARPAVAHPPAPQESQADFPTRAIKNAAGIYALGVFAVAVCAFLWAFSAMTRWLGRDWATLLGMPAVLLPLLIGPLSDRADWRLREWYCKRHGGHVLRPVAGSDSVFTCIRCEHFVVEKRSVD
jgi:hypothetical protein